MRHMIGTLVLLVTLASAARAQYPQEVSPVDQTHSPPAAVFLPDSASGSSAAGWRTFAELEIGARAPDFILEGSQGRPVQLGDLKGHWAAIVFTANRSALAPLKDINAELRKAGVSLYGVCRDAAPKLRDYAKREQLPFVLLSDRSREVSRVYRRYDPDYDLIRPGIVLIDPVGVVRMTQPGRPRHPNELLQRILRVVTGA